MDVVLVAKGLGGRQDYWWVDVEWTRCDHEGGRLRVVEDGWKNVKEFGKVVRDLQA